MPTHEYSYSYYYNTDDQKKIHSKSEIEIDCVEGQLALSQPPDKTKQIIIKLPHKH